LAGAGVYLRGQNVDMGVKSDPAPMSTALARANDAPAAWDDLRFQKLWLATQKRRWRSVAFLGASKRVDTLPVAELFAKLAWWYRGQPSCVFDLRDMSLRLADYHVKEVSSQINEGASVVIALRSIFENPTAAPVARSADAVILCIGLGATEFKAVDKTLAEVGRDRILGSIVIRESTGKGPGK
jgi:hypothetical protein